MTITDALQALQERWRIVVVAVLLGAAAGGVAFAAQPVTYTATITLYVSSQGADSTASDAFQGAQLSAQRVKSYVELATSRRVSSDVVNRLRLEESPDQLSRQITAASTLESVLIEVAVEDRSPARAAQLADVVGAVFTDLVDELEAPVGDGTQAVAVRVVQPAAVPSVPSSGGLRVVLALGMFAGLAAGIGFALLRKALDTSIKSAEQLRAVTEVPNLGLIGYDASTPRSPLTVRCDPDSIHAEAYRQLRTNLQFVDVDRPRKIVVITSSVAGEGKSTTAANLAITMASAGRRVLLIDGDLRRPTLAEMLDLEGTIGLTTVLTGRASVDDVIQHWGGGLLDVLTSGALPPNPSELLGSRQMTEMLTGLAARYDVVLIDTPPLLPVTDAAAVAPASDGVILVCRYKQTKNAHVSASVAALQSVSAPVLGTVLSMAPKKRGPQAYKRYDADRRPSTAVEQTERMPVATNGHKPPANRTQLGRVLRPSPTPRSGSAG